MTETTDSDRVTIKMRASRLLSDADGFTKIAQLHFDLRDHSDKVVDLDLSGVRRVDGHLAASIHVILKHGRRRGLTFEISAVQPDVAAILQKNSFFSPAIADRHNTVIPLTDFDLTQGIDFSLFAKKHLQRPEIPRMTKALQGKFYEGIDELFANSALHSKSLTPVAVCGQFFPRNKRIDFAIVDGGRSIPGAVRSTGRIFRTSVEAIAWAMEPGNTSRSGDIPGGLGSKLLREFVALNSGRLIIASGRGFWCQNGTVIQKSQLLYPFPGTAVILEINTADKNMYDLATAPRPQDIW